MKGVMAWNARLVSREKKHANQPRRLVLDARDALAVGPWHAPKDEDGFNFAREAPVTENIRIKPKDRTLPKAVDLFGVAGETALGLRDKVIFLHYTAFHLETFLLLKYHASCGNIQKARRVFRFIPGTLPINTEVLTGCLPARSQCRVLLAQGVRQQHVEVPRGETLTHSADPTWHNVAQCVRVALVLAQKTPSVQEVFLGMRHGVWDPERADHSLLHQFQAAGFRMHVVDAAALMPTPMDWSKA